MKKCYLLLFSLLLIQTVTAESFRLRLSVHNIQDSTSLHLSYCSFKDGFQQVIECEPADVSNQFFLFTGEIDELTPAIIKVDGINHRIYLEPRPMELIIGGEKSHSLRMVGTSVDDEYSTLCGYLHVNDSLLEKQYMDMSISDDDSYYQVYAETCSKRKDILLDFCTKHIGYRIVPDLLDQILEIDAVPMSTVNNLYQRIGAIQMVWRELSQDNKETMIGNRFHNHLKQNLRSIDLMNNKVGSEAPDISTLTNSQDTIRLHTYRGRKNVLLYFSASWIPIKRIQEDLRLLADRNRSDYEVICVFLTLDKESFQKTAEKLKIDWAVIEDTWKTDLYQLCSWKISSLFHIVELPSLVEINKSGIVTHCQLMK